MLKRRNLKLSVIVVSDNGPVRFDIKRVNDLPASLRAFADLLESGVQFGLDSNFEIHICGTREFEDVPQPKKGGIE